VLLRTLVVELTTSIRQKILLFCSKVIFSVRFVENQSLQKLVENVNNGYYAKQTADT